jgi:hypothetical protein
MMCRDHHVLSRNCPTWPTRGGGMPFGEILGDRDPVQEQDNGEKWGVCVGCDTTGGCNTE